MNPLMTQPVLSTEYQWYEERARAAYHNNPTNFRAVTALLKHLFNGLANEEYGDSYAATADVQQRLEQQFPELWSLVAKRWPRNLTTQGPTLWQYR